MPTLNGYELIGTHLLDGGEPTPERLGLAIALLWEWTLINGTQNNELARLITAVYVNVPSDIAAHMARIRGRSAKDD